MPVLGKTRKGPIMPTTKLNVHPDRLTARQVRTLLASRLNDPKILARYEKEAETMRDHNVSQSHRDRRTRLQQQLYKVGGKPATLIRLWEDTVAPGVAVSYAGTLLKMRPDLNTPLVRDAMDRIRQKASVLHCHRAIRITSEQLNEALRTATLNVARTLILMWVSASRHADLLRMHNTNTENLLRGILLLQWAHFKSDRYGKRAVHKFVYLPSRFRYLFQDWTLATYYQVYTHLKTISKELSVHSLRRAGATLLGEAGFTDQEIGMMTGHTPTSDPHLAVRRYKDPTLQQPESLLQLKMSKTLAMVIAR